MLVNLYRGPRHVCLTNMKKTLGKTKSQVFDLLLDLLQQY